MMELCFYLVCISGICLGSLWAYPIQGTSPNGDDHARSSVVATIESRAGTRPSKSSLPSSRLDRLEGAYMNLVRSQLDAKIRKLSDREDRNPTAEESEFNILLTEALPNNEDTFQDRSNIITFSDSRDEHEDNDDSERSKRNEQAWYIPYGKRSSNLLDTDSIYRHPMRSVLDSNDQITYSDKETQGLLSAQLENNKYTPIADVILSGVLDDLKIDGASDSEGGHRESRVVDVDDIDRNSKRQAQQTWEIQYGKRNLDKLVRHSKRQAQTWEIQYGKRNAQERYLHGL